VKKNLNHVRLQVALGNVPSQVAAEAVIRGDGLSIKGKAILMLSPSGLEKILAELDADPVIAAIIVRAAARVVSEKAAASAAPAERAQGDGEVC
jgi:hypothetical protein